MGKRNLERGKMGNQFYCLELQMHLTLPCDHVNCMLYRYDQREKESQALLPIQERFFDIGKFTSIITSHKHNDIVKIGKHEVAVTSYPTVPNVEYHVVLSDLWIDGGIWTNFRSRASRGQRRMIWCKWGDQSTISTETLRRLCDYIISLLGNSKKVGISCQGAHGRTGTLLAALIMTLERFKAKDAIEEVRQQYCKNAIETKGQENMLVKLERGEK